MHWLIAVALLSVCLFTAPSQAFAQDGEPPTESVVEAKSPVAQAREARERGEFEEALRILEAAQFSAPDDGQVLYERVLTLEAMGEVELALQVVDDKRDVMLRHPEVNDLAVVEQRLISARDQQSNTVVDPSEGNDGDKTAGDKTADQKDTTETSNEDTAPAGSSVASWIAIGAGGAAIAGGAILMVSAGSDADELRCAGLSPEPSCAPDELNPGVSREEYDDQRSSITIRRVVGGTLIGLGAASIAWGIYDLLTGDSEPTSEPSSTTQIEVTPTQSGLSIGVRGQF